ncbi:hypothetical protein FS837_001295 [Tulasnella sp. UAMH 9824]|nr:hypothetical protein FS837_001295 [Tulasnella sp. UAMH 9824]
MVQAESQITELTFRGFAAQIRIGDRPLTVYKPDYDEETKTASGWIASEPGEEYSVCWKKNDVTDYCAAAEVYIDGPRRRSSGIARDYNDDAVPDENVPTDPGTVTVKIFRELITSESREWERVPCDPFSTQIHEKSKKAGGHITKIGDERRVAPTSLISTRPFAEEDTSPYVIFVFHYRPEAILRAEGFIPQPQNQFQSKANQEGDDEEAQAEAEIAALEATRQKRVTALAKRKGLKRKDVEADLARKRRKLKQEEVIDVDLYFTPGEVIDLTDL